MAENRSYTNGDITVYWQPEIRIHSRKCWTSLVSVFNPSKRPWVNMDGAATDAIRTTVENCPSKALTYKMNNELADKPTEVEGNTATKGKLSVLTDGPLKFSGECVIVSADGTETYKSGDFFLCRCGASANKPFCDGSHKKIDFKG